MVVVLYLSSPNKTQHNHTHTHPSLITHRAAARRCPRAPPPGRPSCRQSRGRRCRCQSSGSTATPRRRRRRCCFFCVCASLMMIERGREWRERACELIETPHKKATHAALAHARGALSQPIKSAPPLSTLKTQPSHSPVVAPRRLADQHFSARQPGGDERGGDAQRPRARQRLQRRDTALAQRGVALAQEQLGRGVAKGGQALDRQILLVVARRDDLGLGLFFGCLLSGVCVCVWGGW